MEKLTKQEKIQKYNDTQGIRHILEGIFILRNWYPVAGWIWKRYNKKMDYIYDQLPKWEPENIAYKTDKEIYSMLTVHFDSYYGEWKAEKIKQEHEKDCPVIETAGILKKVDNKWKEEARKRYRILKHLEETQGPDRGRQQEMRNIINRLGRDRG